MTATWFVTWDRFRQRHGLTWKQDFGCCSTCRKSATNNSRREGKEMSTVPKRATLDDLYRTPGKAELIGGRIVEQMTTGIRPNEVAGNIYADLRGYVAQHKRGKAFT